MKRRFIWIGRWRSIILPILLFIVLFTSLLLRLFWFPFWFGGRCTLFFFWSRLFGVESSSDVMRREYRWTRRDSCETSGSSGITESPCDAQSWSYGAHDDDEHDEELQGMRNLTSAQMSNFRWLENFFISNGSHVKGGFSPLKISLTFCHHSISRKCSWVHRRAMPR